MIRKAQFDLTLYYSWENIGTTGSWGVEGFSVCGINWAFVVFVVFGLLR